MILRPVSCELHVSPLGKTCGMWTEVSLAPAFDFNAIPAALLTWIARRPPRALWSGIGIGLMPGNVESRREDTEAAQYRTSQDAAYREDARQVAGNGSRGTFQKTSARIENTCKEDEQTEMKKEFKRLKEVRME